VLPVEGDCDDGIDGIDGGVCCGDIDAPSSETKSVLDAVVSKVDARKCVSHSFHLGLLRFGLPRFDALQKR